MSEERLEIIEKMAHASGAEALILVCREVRRLQARVADLSDLIRSAQKVQSRIYDFRSGV